MLKDLELSAVGFDIDGTLYPNWRIRMCSIAFFLAHSRLILAFSRIRTKLRQLGRLDDIDAMEVRLLAEDMNLSREKARSYRDKIIFKKWEKCFRHVQPYPHVRETLVGLKDLGLKLAALSDFPVGSKLKYFGIEDLFDLVLSYQDIGQLKPQPEPFLLMAEKLGVEPYSILYVGDRLKIDVHGAEAVGMRGALMRVPRRHIPQDVTIFRDYHSLDAQIRKGLQR